MKMEVALEGVSWTVAAAVGVVAIIALVLLAWIGGELHYRSCVSAAEARNPVVLGSGTPSGRLALERREEAIDGCSRLP